MTQSLRFSRLFLGSVVALALVAGAPRDGMANRLEIISVVGGERMRCWDFRGAVVLTNWMEDLGDVGRAWFVNRRPIISLDPERLARLPSKMQVFFYWHECAHHVLGHYFMRTFNSEKEADCWAVKTGRERGLFRRPDVIAFAPYLAHSRGSAFGHLPGPERAKFLLSCFDDPEGVQVFARK